MQVLVLQTGQAIKALKLDVEGFELPVIQGAEQILKQRRVWFMVVELNLLGRQSAAGRWACSRRWQATAFVSAWVTSLGRL